MLASSRILGLGGAYVGVAEGEDGTASNVAAPAVREAYSVHHVELEPEGSVYFPGAFAGTDFENRGSVASRRAAGVENFLYVGGGMLLQVGPFGAAATLDYQRYDVIPPSGGTALGLEVLRGHLIAAWGFFHHQLALGAGLHVVTMSLSQTGLPLSPPSGVGPEVGALLRLDGQPWRLGATLRGPVQGSFGASGTAGADGIRRSDGYVLPDAVVVPAQLEVGVAVQLGPRPLNPPWTDPADLSAPVRARINRDREARQAKRDAELARVQDPDAHEALARELEETERAIRVVEDARIDAEEARLLAQARARYANWPRPHVLVVASVLATAPVGDAVAVSSFLDQVREPYGRGWTASVRYGIEGEPIPDRFRLRFGGYLEPSLFEDGGARQHFTFGGDVKLFSFDLFGILAPTVWQLSFAGDVAPRYSNWGLSLGVWH